MLNGISLFSGYAGIDEALAEYVKTILYCDIEEYSQGIILSRMDDKLARFAPVWNDVTTLDGKQFKGLVDIIFGGFPCQDISVAGKFNPDEDVNFLEKKRSGLFKEIIRIAEQSQPYFIFLENVSAIENRGADKVQEALAEIGFRGRWCHLSASEIGANHQRDRWFCLAANSKRLKLWDKPGRGSRKDGKSSSEPRDNGEEQSVANADGFRLQETRTELETTRLARDGEKVSDSNLSRQRGQPITTKKENYERIGEDYGWPVPSPFNSNWWKTEPDVGRMVNGSSIRMDSLKSMGGILVDKRTLIEADKEEVSKLFRIDRVKALGNGVVPLQVKTAFEYLMGLNHEN